jgi:plastocyanin
MLPVTYHIISTPNGPSSPDPLDLGLLVVLLIGISYLTYELVERKTTTRRRLAPPVTTIAAALIGLTISFVILPTLMAVPTSPQIAVVSIPAGAYTTNFPNGFQPATITVVLGVNNTVGWQNLESRTCINTCDHNAHSDSGLAFFYSGNIPPGFTNKITFTTVGTYPYHCDYHSWMRGTVIVKGR